MSSSKKNLHQAPPVNLVLRNSELEAIRNDTNHDFLVNLIRQYIEITQLFEGSMQDRATTIAKHVASEVRKTSLTARRKINATGIVIHTGWGNASLSSKARTRLNESMGATETGGKGAPQRFEICESSLKELTRAEAATVLTSNAASYVLMANALALGKEIVVASRDLVEISDGARVRDLLEAGGARVKQVGSANCVNLKDYENAIGEDTALILRVHASNMLSTGYVAHVTSDELARLAHAKDLIFAENLGGGSLVDLSTVGLPWCATLQRSVADGADISFASGDKVLGGPQAGIVVGKQVFLNLLSENVLARAFRPGKLTLAALEATLNSYTKGNPWSEVPVLKLLTVSIDQLKQRGERIVQRISDLDVQADVAAGHAECGGAVLPGVKLPTWMIRIRANRYSEDELYAALLSVGVVSRREEKAVVLDLRSVLEDDDDKLVDGIFRLFRDADE